LPVTRRGRVHQRPQAVIVLAPSPGVEERRQDVVQPLHLAFGHAAHLFVRLPVRMDKARQHSVRLANFRRRGIGRHAEFFVISHAPVTETDLQVLQVLHL
jgi:hypothetical protein